MNPAERDLRFTTLREIGCLCCLANLAKFLAATGMATEIHHLNSGGHAGQKRRGDEFSVGLCSWHHRGVLLPARGMTRLTMIQRFGPSLAGGSKPFRRIYGDDEHLLRRANEAIARRPSFGAAA